MKSIFYFLLVLAILTASTALLAESSTAISKLNKTTDTLSRFSDSDVATSEGYVHYDGYDTFDMGEHWYKRGIYESGTCSRNEPTHLQYLVIDGKRTLIGTGYICLPEKNRIFDNKVTWHSHGPAWCLLPNGSTEDYRDLADHLPNKLNKRDWQSICRQEGGTPASQKVKMLHTWNWIPAPTGMFAHTNLAIPFLRVGLPTPDEKFLNSQTGQSVIKLLKLAHGDTHWWYWRGLNVIDADEKQRQKAWATLQHARTQGQIIQNEMLEVGNLQDLKITAIANEGDNAVDTMHEQLAEIFTNDQMNVFNQYITSLQTHDHHEHEH